MVRHVVRLILSLALSASLGCGEGTGGDGGTLSLRIHSPAGAPIGELDATHLRIRIEGADLAAPLVVTAPLTAGSAAIDQVPYGLERHITVEVLKTTDDNETVAARGHSGPIHMTAPGSASVDIFVAPVASFSELAPFAQPTLPVQLVQGRIGHSLTLLADGRVLIAGGARLNEEGTSLQELTSSMEIFDPRTGELQLLDTRLEPARAFHSATRLRGTQGLVLFAGGLGQINTELVSLQIADLFDPSGDGSLPLVPAQDLIGPRARHSATLRPDGSVLLAGGINLAGGKPEDILRFNGIRTAVLASAELFRAEVSAATAESCNGSQWTFCLQQPLAQARADHAAMRLGRFVIHIGGRDHSGPLQSSEMFMMETSSPTGSFFDGPPLSKPRAGATVLKRSDESIVVIGGQSNTDGIGELFNDLELYDPVGTYEFVPQQVDVTTGLGRRDAFGFVLPDDSILVGGGMGPSGVLNDAWLFPATQGEIGVGRRVGDLQSARAKSTALVLDTGAGLVLGGFHGRGQDSNIRFPDTLELYTP